MEEASNGHGGRWDEKARKEGEWKLNLHKLKEKEIQEVGDSFPVHLTSYYALSLYRGERVYD